MIHWTTPFAMTTDATKSRNTLGAVHKLRHFKIDLYGSSNNDST